MGRRSCDDTVVVAADSKAAVRHLRSVRAGVTLSRCKPCHVQPSEPRQLPLKVTIASIRVDSWAEYERFRSSLQCGEISLSTHSLEAFGDLGVRYRTRPSTRSTGGLQSGMVELDEPFHLTTERRDRLRPNASCPKNPYFIPRNPPAVVGR